MATLTQPQTDFINNLLSGEFGQAKGKLRMEDVDGKQQMCCLGVGTETYRRSVEGALPWSLAGSDDKVWYTYAGDGGVLPEIVAEWLGIPDPFNINNPTIWKNTTTGGTFSASSCNDTHEFPFEVIAFLFWHLFTAGKCFEGTRADVITKTTEWETDWRLQSTFVIIDE